MRRRLVFAALAAAGAAAVAAGGGASATLGLPVGTAGESSPNVHPLANFPTGSGVGGHFLGDYYFQTTSTLADLVGVGPTALGGGLAVFDVKNPEKPAIAGYLPLPHWENEDVSISASRKLLIISMDHRRANPLDSKSGLPGKLNIIDISKPASPKLLSTIDYPENVGINPKTGNPLGGSGHTASFVAKDQYIYVSGARDGSTLVVDAKNARAPKVLGAFKSPAGVGNAVFTTGVVHDAFEDEFKNIWLTGSGGTAMYAPIGADPLHPKLLAASRPKDNKKLNQYITHNALRIDKDTVMVTEESYDASDCGKNDGTGLQDGSIQLWHINLATHQLLPISTFDTPNGSADSGIGHDLLGFCSSHWFTMNKNKIVADAWYSAGVRFLDISDPKKIRPVGYYSGDSNIASQAVFVPGRPDLVYVADYMRGLDVVKLENAGVGAKTVTTPVKLSKAAGLLRPSADFGWVCAVADSSTPMVLPRFGGK